MVSTSYENMKVMLREVTGDLIHYLSYTIKIYCLEGLLLVFVCLGAVPTICGVCYFKAFIPCQKQFREK